MTVATDGPWGIGSDDESEVHQFNPLVRKGQDGIWGSDEVPVVVWEVADARVVLTRELQDTLKLETPILRWSAAKRDAVFREHGNDPRDSRALEDIGNILRLPVKAGRDPRPGRTEWLVFAWVDGRLFRVVIGRDKEGGVNIVTLYGSSNPQRIRQWIREMERMGD